jgi:hypothetical protein
MPISSGTLNRLTYRDVGNADLVGNTDRLTYRDVGNADLVGNTDRPTREEGKGATAPLRLTANRLLSSLWQSSADDLSTQRPGTNVAINAWLGPRARKQEVGYVQNTTRNYYVFDRAWRASYSVWRKGISPCHNRLMPSINL